MWLFFLDRYSYVPRPLQGIVGCSGEMPVLLADSHFTCWVHLGSLSYRVLKFLFQSILYFVSYSAWTACFSGKASVLFWLIYSHVEMQSFWDHWKISIIQITNFSVFPVTDFFSPYAFLVKAIPWLKTRARGWTLTSSSSSCWISEGQSRACCGNNNKIWLWAGFLVLFGEVPYTPIYVPSLQVLKARLDGTVDNLI